MKEVRDDLQSREVTVQALKGKVAELYVEVQTALQAKVEADGEAGTARGDLAALLRAKEWCQEQLATAHQVRATLQRQLTQLQAQTVSQVGPRVSVSVSVSIQFGVVHISKKTWS